MRAIPRGGRRHPVVRSACKELGFPQSRNNAPPGQERNRQASAGPLKRDPPELVREYRAGEARLGIEGQPPKVVPTGQGFFEPIGGIHNVSESTSPTEAATGIVFMIVPDGAPLATTVPAEHSGH